MYFSTISGRALAPARGVGDVVDDRGGEDLHVSSFCLMISAHLRAKQHRRAQQSGEACGHQKHDTRAERGPFQAVRSRLGMPCACAGESGRVEL